MIAIMRRRLRAALMPVAASLLVILVVALALSPAAIWIGILWWGIALARSVIN